MLPTRGTVTPVLFPSGLPAAATRQEIHPLEPWLGSSSSGRARNVHMSKSVGILAATSALFSLRRRSRRSASAAVRLAAAEGTQGPLFANIMSTQADWKAAVAEIKAEAMYELRSRSTASWDFGIVFVSGYDNISVADVAQSLDTQLGTGGRLLGVATDGCAGWGTDMKRRSQALPGQGKGILLVAIKMPEEPSEAAKASWSQAKPFFINKEELLKISSLICRFQGSVRVRGADEPATPRAWRHYLGLQKSDDLPKGMLLFVDPLASKYTVQTIIDGLDMALPLTVKLGGVAADLPPPRARLAMAGLPVGNLGAATAGVVGILLPPQLNLHTVASPGVVPVGPEMRVTLADGQVVSEINGEAASKALEDVGRNAGPLERLLIERSGFLLGLEAPRQQMDPDRSKTWDDTWASSARAPAYSWLQKQATASDWLVRSIELLPSGAIVVRREDLKRVPPRVGPAWLRCRLHVQDHRRARGELRLMLQRYLGARMMIPKPTPPPFGALVCACHTWVSASDTFGDGEVGVAELDEVFGKQMSVACVATNLEVAPPGVAIGGIDQRRTTRQGHTASFAFLSYEPDIILGVDGLRT